MPKDPGDFSIGDIIRATHLNSLDALARAEKLSEPAISEQVRSPNESELEEIEQLAYSAAQLQDELRTAIGDKDRKLRVLREQLKQRLIQHGMKEISIAGRPPIELTESNSRKPTRKSLIEVLQRQLGDKVGKMKALNLWNALPQSTSYGLSIPDPTPPEVDSPY